LFPSHDLEGVESEDKSGEEASPEADLLEVKVDGELQKVSLQDLKNNYAGKQAWDKKFSDLDKERKTYKAEVDQINQYVKDLGDTMRNSSILDGMQKIAELVGMKPHEAKKQLIEQIIPEINRLSEMSEKERDLEYKKQEVEYDKVKFESDQKKSKQEQAVKDLEREISAEREAYKISDQEWDSAFKALDESLPKDEMITPKIVSDRVIYNRSETRANDLLSKFNKDLLSDKSVFSEVHRVVYDHFELSDNDFLDLLGQAYGMAKSEKAEEQVKEAVAKKDEKVKEEEEDTGGIQPILDPQVRRS